MRTTDRAALFLVADGIGGRTHGEVISGMLQSGFDRWWTEYLLPVLNGVSFRDALESMKETLWQINREIVMRFGEWNVGSTIAILFLFDSNCAYLSSGDSRIYRVKGWRLQQMTTDDICENQPQNCYHDSTNGKLVRAIGISNHLEFSLRTEPVGRGDRFFVCSDGVYRYVTPQCLRSRLLIRGALASPAQVIKLLCTDIERSGAGDNYSMIFVKLR